MTSPPPTPNSPEGQQPQHCKNLQPPHRRSLNHPLKEILHSLPIVRARERLVRYWAAEDLAERLPAFFDAVEKEAFWGHDAPDVGFVYVEEFCTGVVSVG